MTDMSVYAINPIQDSRWRAFLEQDSRASVFHDPRWLEALRTYNFEPVVVTTCGPGQALTNGTCSAASELVDRRRLVSLPFSDHCQPLVSGPPSAGQLMLRLQRVRRRKVGLRRNATGQRPFHDRASVKETQVFCLHRLICRAAQKALSRLPQERCPEADPARERESLF
jgi:hypothetical protein